MKKVFTLSAVILLAGTAFSQNAIDRYFGSYKDDPSFTKVEITGKMMELAGYIEPQNEAEAQLADAAKKIKGISVLAKEEAKDSKALFSAANKKIGTSFAELMSVVEETTEVKVYVKESAGIITEVLVLANDPGVFCIVDVYGEIDLSTIRTITDGFKIGGMEKVDQDLLQAASDIRMFPNPVNRGQNCSLSFDSKAEGGSVTIFDSAGKQMWSKLLTGSNVELKSGSLSQGVYTVVVEKGNARLFSQALMVN